MTWKINEHVNDRWEIRDHGADGRVTGEVATVDYTGGDAEQVAHLIAAAPAMLDALQRLDALITIENENEGLTIEQTITFEDAHANARTAIAQATA